MIDKQLNIKDYILDYFNNFESAHIMDLYDYIYSCIEEVPDFDKFNEELIELSQNKIIKIENEFIHRISIAKQSAKSLEFRLGSYNFVINAEIDHPHFKELNLDLICNSIKETKIETNNIEIVKILGIDLDKRVNRLVVEVSGDEW